MPDIINQPLLNMLSALRGEPQQTFENRWSGVPNPIQPNAAATDPGRYAMYKFANEVGLQPQNYVPLDASVTGPGGVKNDSPTVEQTDRDYRAQGQPDVAPQAVVPPQFLTKDNPVMKTITPNDYMWQKYSSASMPPAYGGGMHKIYTPNQPDALGQMIQQLMSKQ